MDRYAHSSSCVNMERKCFWQVLSDLKTPGVTSIENASNFSSSAVSCVNIILLFTFWIKSSYLQKIEGKTRWTVSLWSAYFPSSFLVTLKCKMSPEIYSTIPLTLPLATTAIVPSSNIMPVLICKRSISCTLCGQFSAQYISSGFSVP